MFSQPSEPSNPFPAGVEASGCPEPQVLEFYVRGELPSGQAAALDRHLAECPACLDRLLARTKNPPGLDIPQVHAVGEIGRGRFGVVYKAWWLRDRPRLVALKVQSGNGPMERSRFEREVAVLKKIHSPGIVSCLHADVAANVAYYVMDFVHGVHLDEYLAGSSLSLAEKLEVFQRVCRAVADAHAAGVIHRDLKPRNIVVDEFGAPHILDFGICALETPDWSSWIRQTITRAGDIIGTLRYMSPEQAWGGVAGPIDERSDVWSLGVMLYEIVTDGDYPYSLAGTVDKPPHEHLLDQIRKELPRLRRLDHLPRGRDLETLVERCLAWEPQQRLGAVATLADDLARYCAGERIRTRPLGIPYRMKRLAVGAATRSRWPFAASFLALLAVLLWGMVLAFDVGWHVPARSYLHRVNFPAGVPAVETARDLIRVVGIDDDTPEVVSQFAAQQGIEGVTGHVVTWRGVHGHLLTRLPSARPLAVVWDYYFRSAQPPDPQLLAGLKSLEDKEVPVILATASYAPDGSPRLSPTLRDGLGRRLRHGGILARDMVHRPGEFVLAVKRDESSVFPGLAVSTLAAILHPEARMELEWSGREPTLGLVYQTAPGAYLRQRDRIELSATVPAGRRQDLVETGDLLACRQLALDRPDRWRQRTLSYHSLLTCSDAELESLVEGKILLFGDLRAAPAGQPPDRHRVRYGMRVVEGVPGCYLLADAVAGLIDGGLIRSAFPLAPATFLGMLMLGGLGCLLPIRFAVLPVFQAKAFRCALWAGFLVVPVGCVAVMALSRDAVAVHGAMAGLSLLVPMAGALWVELARNRHRILERKRRAVESFQVPLDGTLTLATLPRKSLTTAG